MGGRRRSTQRVDDSAVQTQRAIRKSKRLGYDFQVEARARKLHASSQRVVHFECEIRDRFGALFRTYIIPY